MAGPVERSDGEVVVRRSARRRRTVSAYRENGRTIVLIPARMSRAEEARWVSEMLARLAASEQRRRPSDALLLARAEELSRRYLQGRARPASVAWSQRQHGRWGSATPSDATIRISARLQGMPAWVIDYVLVHELAHLIEPSHDRRFWSLVGRYPRAERARGYLEGVAAVAGLPGLTPGAPETPDTADAPDASDGPEATSTVTAAAGTTVPAAEAEADEAELDEAGSSTRRAAAARTTGARSPAAGKATLW